MKTNQFFAVIAVLRTIIASQVLAAPSFHAERVLFNADPSTHVLAIDVNNSGLVLAETYDFTYATRPFLWQAGNSDLVFEETKSATVTALSDAGEVIGTFPNNQGFIAHGDQVTPFGAPGMYGPNAISTQGDVFGENYGGGPLEAFRAVALIDGVFQDLGVDIPGYASSAAKGANSSNHVVGTIQTAAYVAGVQGTRAWFWRDGHAALLPTHDPTDPTPSSNAFSINDNDEIVGFDYSLQGEGGAALWKNQQLTILPSPGPSYYGPQARRINNQTQIVGTAVLSEYSYAVAGIFWDSDGAAYDLNKITSGIAGWHLISAVAINGSGQVLAEAIYGTPDQIVDGGVLHGTFLLSPVPEPGSAALAVVAMLAGLFVLGTVRRRGVPQVRAWAPGSRMQYSAGKPRPKRT